MTELNVESLKVVRKPRAARKPKEQEAPAPVAMTPVVDPTSVAEVAATGTPTVAFKLPKLPKTRKPKAPKVCACGCTGTTKGGRFIPGHDAKLHGIIKRLELGVMQLSDLDASHRDAVLAAGWSAAASAVAE